MSDRFLWFSLVPKNVKARTVLDFHRCTEPMAFYSDQRSKRNTGVIAYLGHDPSKDDVLLIDGESKGRCCFAITEAGDLMLCDVSGRVARKELATRLMVKHRGGSEIKELKIRRPGDCCVLPRSPDVEIIIALPSLEWFELRWGIDLDWETVQNARRILSMEYLIRAAQSSALVGPPLGQLEPDKAEPRTDMTPYTPNFGLPILRKQTHNYQVIRKSWSGIVHLTIDIHNGKQYTTKSVNMEECPRRSGGYKAFLEEFKHEAEMLATLDHPHITKLKHHQGWPLTLPVQLFLPPYESDATSLVTAHSCRGPISTENIEHLPRFLTQCLGALRYLHERDLVHRDVKLEHVLFRRNGDELTFFLSDFGLATSTSAVREDAGDICYWAPELFREGARCGRPTDMYAFGVAILEFIGVICPDEYTCSTAEWRERLAASGCVGEPSDARPEGATVYACPRVQALRASGLLCNPALERMLDPEPENRPLAGWALSNLADYYGFEVPPEFFKLSDA
ncbi:hypothetical protein V2A60_004108 [Cordyceps javanica]